MRLTSFRYLLSLSVTTLISCGALLAQNPARQVTTGKYRYWADTTAGVIWQSNLDGSFAKTVVADLKGPYGVSLDPIAGVILWTNSDDGTVQRWNPVTGQLVTLKSEFEEPYGIVLDEGTRKIAYAVVEGNVVKVVQDDLSEAESLQILVPGETGPPTLASLQRPSVDSEDLSLSRSADFIEDIPPPIHGLALDTESSSTDLGAAVLYIGDGYGMMARRVRLADNQVDALVFDDAPVAVAPSLKVAR